MSPAQRFQNPIQASVDARENAAALTVSRQISSIEVDALSAIFPNGPQVVHLVRPLVAATAEVDAKGAVSHWG